MAMVRKDTGCCVIKHAAHHNGDGQEGHRLLRHAHVHVQGDGGSDDQGHGDRDQLLQSPHLSVAEDRPYQELQ